MIICRVNLTNLTKFVRLAQWIYVHFFLLMPSKVISLIEKHILSEKIFLKVYQKNLFGGTGNGGVKPS
jgi:hypothetical protein